jgi:putative ABC transport system ATP-binding protein
MNNIITVKNLSKTFGKVKAVQDVSFEIKKGEFIAIQGQSGSGKSTLLSLLAGLERASKGEIHIEKENICAMNEDQLAIFRRNNIGIVFQFFNLIPTLNTIENIAIPLFPVKMDKKTMFKKAKDASAQVGLSERLDHYPNQLSGGEQQRVAIARALINTPKVIFADEPTGNLDANTSKKIIAILKELHKNKRLTIVMVTHDDAIAKEADRIIKVRDGMIYHE